MWVSSGSLDQPGARVNLLKMTLKVCVHINSAETDLGPNPRSATCWLGDPGQITRPHKPQFSHLHHRDQRTRLRIEAKSKRNNPNRFLADSVACRKHFIIQPNYNNNNSNNNNTLLIFTFRIKD